MWPSRASSSGWPFSSAGGAFRRNISALLLHLTRDGELAIDTSDEIQAGVVVAHDGKVVHEGVASLLLPAEGDTGVDGPSD